jgi:hypothetical protein
MGKVVLHVLGDFWHDPILMYSRTEQGVSLEGGVRREVDLDSGVFRKAYLCGAGEITSGMW